MTIEYCKEMILELVGYYNLCESSMKRLEINKQIAKYKKELAKLSN